MLASVLGVVAVPARSQTPGGNVLDPTGLPSARELDPRGMSHYHRAPRRGPSGFLYAVPWRPPTPTQTAFGWAFSGSLEVGAIGDEGDEKETRFESYADWTIVCW